MRRPIHSVASVLAAIPPRAVITVPQGAAFVKASTSGKSEFFDKNGCPL